MNDLFYLKLGGSLLTDKTGVEALRVDVVDRLAREIAAARQASPARRVLLGHGSGSFGHVAGARYGTRRGVRTTEEWRGFAEVSDAAARLNRLVVAALLRAGLPALGLQPSASAQCNDGLITSLAAEPVRAALEAGLLPVVYGDVAFDVARGGTIISTEEVMMALAGTLRPRWFLLAGETAGVYDLEGKVIPLITRDNFPEILPALGASRGTDVTGGMAEKVKQMLTLASAQPGLSVRIFSGLQEGLLAQTLINPASGAGTTIR